MKTRIQIHLLVKNLKNKSTTGILTQQVALSLFFLLFFQGVF